MKMIPRTFYLALLTAAMMTLTAVADNDRGRDAPDSDDDAWKPRRNQGLHKGRPDWAGPDRNGGDQRRGQALKRLINHLKQTDPEKYDELQALREEDPEAFRREMRTLVREKGKNFRDSKNDRRQNRNKMKKHMGRGMLEHLKDEDPDKFEELKKLREEDPQAFQEQVKEIFKDRARARNDKRRDTQKRVHTLVEQYRNAGSDDEKAAIREKLADTLNEGFEARLQEQQKRIEQMETQLGTLRKRVEERRAKRDAILTKHLDQLLTEPHLRFDE